MTLTPETTGLTFNEEIVDMIFNSSMSRMDLMRKFMDPRRDYDKECGYPQTASVSPHDYKKLWDREPIAARVVGLLPEECWKYDFQVFEDEDADTVTAFEEDWDTLSTTLRGGSLYHDEKSSPIWEYLKRLDICSRIGSFGVMLLGLNDLSPEETMRKPAPGFEIEPSLSNDQDSEYNRENETGVDGSASPSPTDVELLYLRVFDESLVDIVQYETRIDNPRYGQPIMYKLTFVNPEDQSKGGIGLPLATQHVHWSRVIHVADNLTTSEVFGASAMRPVLNRLIDLIKLYGGSAEMYWKGAFPGLALEIDPRSTAEGGIDKSAVREAMYKYTNSLQRWFALEGITAKTLSPQVSDPSGQIEVALDAICVQIGVPKRIFMGSERGELASTQDKSSWNETLMKRNKTHCIPRIIIPFVDRLITVGVLTAPEGFSVEVDDMDMSSATERATVASTQTTAMSTYVSGGVDALIEPMDYFTRILKMSEEEAQSILDNRSRTLEDKRAQEDLAGLQSVDPNLGEDPPEEDPATNSGQPIGNAFCPTGKGGGVDPTCGKGSNTRLSAEAEAAVADWWQGGYEEINSNLRDGNSHPSVKGLMEAINSAEPLKEDIVMYRGMSLPESSSAAQNMRKKYSVYDEGFMAVSHDKQIAERFAIGGDLDNNAYVIEMKIKAGTKLADIPSGIQEKLLPPGKRFIIDKVSKKGNVRYVEARYID